MALQSKTEATSGNLWSLIIDQSACGDKVARSPVFPFGLETPFQLAAESTMDVRGFVPNSLFFV